MKSVMPYKKYFSASHVRCCLFMIALWIISIGSAAAQYPVKVNVQVRQPVSPYLPQILGELEDGRSGAMTRDITDRLHIALHHSGNVPKHVKLSGKLERISPAPMSISLRPGFAPPNPILMNPGQMIQANRQLLNQAFGGFNKNDLIFNNTGLSELRQNNMNYKLPEGMYRICISAFDYDKAGMTGPLSAPGTGCATFMICYSVSAPQLIMPVSTMGFSDNNSFQSFTPHSSQVQFTWTPPASTCGLPIGALTYDLSIRRVFPGQAINDALFNPPVFQKENIHATTFLLDTIRYPHVLRSGENYIFRVKANFIPTPGSPLEMDNRGYSQIGSFAFNPSAPPSNADAAGAITSSNKDTLRKVPTLIKGRLKYRFGNDLETEHFPLANQKVYIKRVYVKTGKDADGVTHFNPLSEAEQNNLPAYPEMLDGQITETDEEGRFELKVGMTEMDEAGLLTGEQWQNLFAVQYDGNDQLLPESPNPDIPDLLKDLEGQMVRLYKVEVVNPHFKPSEEYVQIAPGGERNLRNVVVEANSYTLKVNVREVAAAQKGAFAEGATIKLYRLTKNKTNPNLSIPYFEGDLLNKSDWKEEGDKVLIASKITPDPDPKTDNPDDYTVNFTRLFRSSEGELYDYIVCLENGKGALRLHGDKEWIIGPPVPQSSSVWGVFNDLGHGRQERQGHGDHSSLAEANKISSGTQPTWFGGDQQLLPGGNNLLVGAGSPVRTGHGPYAGTPSLYSLPKEKERSTAAPQREVVAVNGIMDYENKWSSWSYNGDPDVAYLTLEKELAEPPHSVVTGKLEYKFKGDPSIPAQPYANMPVKLMVFYLMKNGEQVEDPSNTDYYSDVVHTYANQDLPEGYEFGYPLASDGTIDKSILEDDGKVLQTTYTDAEGNFSFDFENLDSSMQVVSGSTYFDYENEQYGNSRELINGEFMRVYRIVPAVNQYTAPDDNIPVQPWEDYDCGTLTSFVRTFNMEVAVKAESTLLQQNDIPVQLYYNPNANPQYPIPTKPGLDLNTPSEVNGESYILIRKDMASEKKEETFQNALNEAAVAALEAGLGTSVSTIPDKTYQFKTTTFKDLVISQSAADYSRFYYIEAGGTPLDRAGNITLESDYLAYPKNQISDNWDSDFYNYRSQNGMDDHLTTVTRDLEQKILFNSEFDPNRTIRVYLAPDPAEPRIAGRLVDRFTTLGVHGSWGSVQLKVKRTQYGRYTSYATGEAVEVVSDEPYENEYTYRIPTNEYGYFDFKEFTADFNNRDIVSIEPVELVIDVPGYKDTTIQMPQVMQDGQQVYMDPIIISPKCAGCYGFVVDEDDPEQGVAARVKILINGRWVDTYPYSEGSPVITAGNNYLFTAGILDKTIMHAAMDANMSNPGFIDSDFRPVLGQSQMSNLAQATGGHTTANRLQQNGVIPGHGPNALLTDPFDFDPPGEEEWQTFGGLQVRTNSEGEVKEARIIEGAEGAGMWQSYVNAVNGQSGIGGMTAVPTGVTGVDIVRPVNSKQRFDLSMPLLNTGTKIIILPYDRSYIPDTVEVNSYTGENLGTFKMKRRKHKIKVVLDMKDKKTGMAKVPTGAIISIEGVEEEQVVDENGVAYFEFVNNSTSNFTLRVRPQKQKSVAEGLAEQMRTPGVTFSPGARNDLDVANPATEEQPNASFVPRTVNFSNEDDNVEHVISVELKEGGILSGQVTFEKDGTPVENAVVYMDQGQGIRTDIITVTDEDGYYTLVGVPVPETDIATGQLNFNEFKLGASYSDKVHSYIGAAKNVPFLEADNPVNFQIKEINDMDLTHLLGMPVRLTEAEKEGENGYKVSGAFFDLPANANFSVSQNSSGSTLAFNEVSVTASELINENGIPLAVPVEDKIPLDNKIYPVKAFEVYNAKMTAQRSNEMLKMERVDSDTTGVLRGAVRIVDNSFNFPSSYMTISNTDFYLGNFGMREHQQGDNQEGGNTQSNDQQNNLQSLSQQTMVVQNTSPQGMVIQGVAGSTINRPVQTADDKLIIPVFSSGEYPLTKFSLSDIKGNGIQFNYLGFDGTTGNSGSRESYIRGDSVNLYLDLTARIRGGIELNFNAGKAVLTHNQMKSVSNDDTLRMQLEKWEVMSTAWELSPSSGGIVLRDGILNTGVVGLPFTNMSIIPGDPEGELICNSLDAASLKEAADEGKLVLGGGAAELGLYDNIDITFVYDPDVGTTPGEGHYKFSLHSVLGKVAYFGGLDGMTDPSQRFDVQFVSTLSNGEQLFAFDGEMESITLYNQIHFTPQRLFNYEDNFSVGGLMYMNVPDMPKNIGLDLRYDYTGKKEIRNELTMSPIDFHFTGNGGSKFKVDLEYEDLQRIDKEVVAFPGIITLPNSSQIFNANFVSIVYEGAQDPIPATGKVAYNRSLSSDRYAYYSRGGGIQAVGNAGYANFVKDNNSSLFALPNEDVPDMKVQTEIFVGTSEQLFGDAAKALTGSLSSMGSYGGGAAGTMSDFSNEIYNEASNSINDLNTRGRQAYNNLLNQVGSLRLEAHKAYDKVTAQIDALRVNGQEAHEQVYGEILAQLDDLKAHSDALYNEVLSKRNDFLNYGNEVYSEVYGNVTEQVEGVQGNAQEMYNNLTGEITGKISEFQTYSERIYGGVTDKANELRAMGDGMYDELYGELSAMFNNISNKGDEVARAVTGIINGYRDYGAQLYADATGNIEDIVNSGEEALNQMMGEADKLRQQADDAYNEVAAQIADLEAQGRGAYADAQREMLAHLDEVRSQAETVYNDLQAKRDEWMQNGQDIINGATEQIEDLQAYGREMYDGLYSDISGKADALQAYAEGLYGGVEGQIQDLRSMGQDIYDEAYGEISGTMDEFKAYGDGVYSEVNGTINEYRDYGEDLYNDIYGSVSGKVDEIRSYAEGVAGDVVQHGADALNEVLAGPVGAVIDEMNGVRNTAEQYIGMGTQKVDSIMAKWPIAGEAIDAFKDFDGNDIEGSLLRMAGNMVGFDGIKENAKDKLILVANETVEGIKESLEIDNISESVSDAMSNDVFKGMNIDFDLNTGRMTGSMYSDFISFGAVELSQLGIEVLIDGKGWYFYTGAGIDMPASTPLNPIIFPIGVGFLVGMYPTISPSLESRVTQHSYVHQLPSSVKSGLSGFFLTGKKDILRPTSVAINFAIVDFEIGASAGLDARLYANFESENTTSIGLGMMAFADAYARLSVLGTCGISGSAAANVGIKASYVNSPAGSSLSAAACASVAVSGSAWCGWGEAKVSGSFNESIMAMLKLCAGDACREAVTMDLELGSTCVADNKFDYAN